MAIIVWSWERFSFSLFSVYVTFLINLAWTATNVPRRIGIAGFYGLTMLVELLYFTDFVQENLIVSTILIGVSRLFALNGYCLVACC